MNERHFTLGVLVDNKYGVLTRVSSLFSRRGFNIDSLTVGETDDPAVSRMTVVSSGDDHTLDQIVKQLLKLVDVRNITVLEPDSTVYRELMLIKVKAKAGKRTEIMEAVNVFRANVVDLAPDTLTAEPTGSSSKLDAFIEYVRPFGIEELCRTGITAMSRGKK